MATAKTILPSSYPANKRGYNKYTTDGGAMDYASFIVYERRTALEIAAEKHDRLHASMVYYHEMWQSALNAGDEKSAELYEYTLNVRIKQLSLTSKELDALMK